MIVQSLKLYLIFWIVFRLVYVLMLLAPQYRRKFVKVFVVSAFIVIGFALLQQVLPRDFLANFGYSSDTIAPYMTVDENDDFVRHNSTLRGPNPLGAYAATVATVCLAWLIGMKQKRNWPIIGLAAASVLVVYLSYARSAYLALTIGFAITLAALFGKKVKKWQWLGLGAVTLVLIGSLFLLRNNDFVSNVVLHEDPGESNNLNSNDGHIDSLAEGTERMLNQPLGAGVGSTGSASLLTENGLIIENHYLYVAHEVGWLGFVVFLVLFVAILKRLWSERKNPLALGVFASGIGLAAAALFLPVWADDTVSIIWWGLAALASAPRK
jgi:O-antigen ligase